jgi:catechol 2,3-dioxygenase-like lactoylglutathione lyase family enzyme
MDMHAYIAVMDLQRGIAFYTQGLGLRFRRRLGANWVELEGASVPIFCCPLTLPETSRGTGPCISTFSQTIWRPRSSKLRTRVQC